MTIFLCALLYIFAVLSVLYTVVFSLNPFSISCYFPFPLQLVTTGLFSAFASLFPFCVYIHLLCFSVSICKCYRIFLTYFTEHNISLDPSVHSIYIYIIYKYTHICYIFFIHPSADGHLSFHLLIIINSAAVNIGVHLPFQIDVFIFSDICQRSGIG